jgi:hypothetical protein
MAAELTLSSWLIHKLAYAGLLTVLGFAGAALWIFNHGADSFLTSQHLAVKALTQENLKLKEALVAADNRLAIGRTEVAAQNLRAEQAAKIGKELDGLSSGLNRFTTSSEQLDENERRMARMKQMEVEARSRAADGSQNLVRTQWEKDGIELALARNQALLKTASEERSPFLRCLRQAWISDGKAIFVGVGLLMLAPPFWRLVRPR